MIAPMTRFQFVVFHKDVETFLEALREKGMMEITSTDWIASEGEREMFERSESLKKVASAMRAHLKKAKTDSVLGDRVGELPCDVDALAQMWSETENSISNLKQEIELSHQELENVLVWGSFDHSMVEKLSHRGITLDFYRCSPSDFKSEWAEQYLLETIHDDGKMRYFVAVSSPELKAENITAVSVSQPKHSASEMESKIANLKNELLTKEALQYALSQKHGIIEDEQALTQENFELSRAKNSGTREADNKIVVMEGWCVSENKEELVAFANEQELYFECEDAKEEHNPPVKLKNTFFARLFEPVGDLYMNPRYNELDLTLFFAPFFMIFFGMCLGDAAYGALFIGAIALMWKKIPKAYKDFAWLGLFLGFSGMVFGVLTGNFAGIELFKIEALEPYRKYMLLRDPNVVFTFSIALGAVQVLFGQILRIFNRIKRGGGFIYGVSSIGWVMLMSSSIVVYITGDSQAMWYKVVLGIAGVFILFFANPKKNVFVSFGAGLYSVYEMATGVIGDLVSYVRLFAIGLAGAIIAQVFNQLAVGLSGDIPVVSWIVMLIILVIGHGLNIFLSSLGAFVHPVRLTFVEFFKNAEFEGGSRKFAPLKRIFTNRD